MATYDITPELQEQLDDINQKFKDAYDNKLEDTPNKVRADRIWEHLQESEKYLALGTLQTDDYDDKMENILALYHLNQLIDEGYLTPILRDVFDLPPSTITSDIIDERLDWAGWVAGDGTIYAASRYCQLDFRWVLVMVYYYYYKLRPNKKHKFVEPGTIVPDTNPPLKASIAIIGDWGTGVWKDGQKKKCPAQLVIEGVLAKKPDYIIHLGDVYYAGTSREEKKHLLQLLPENYHNKVYTMNSNHEMYDGAVGLMGTTLADPRFSQQKKSTCFSLQIGGWIFVGLDSAYYDDSFLYMKGALQDSEGHGQCQLQYLNEASKTGKKVFLLTHHNGIEVAKRGPAPNKTLWDQVLTALDQKLPEVWYWGHVHNGIVYRDDLSFYGKHKSKMRCCGHASIPFGNGSYLKAISENSSPEVLYYSHTPMPHPTDEVQKLRVLNGFAMIDIDGDTMSESFYEVSNDLSMCKKVWPQMD